MFRRSFLIVPPRLCIRTLQCIRPVTLPSSHCNPPRWKAYSSSTEGKPRSQPRGDEIYQLNPKGDVPVVTGTTRLPLSDRSTAQYGGLSSPRWQRSSAPAAPSPQTLTLDSVFKEEEQVPQEEVNRSIDGLRPDRDLLEDAEYWELQQKLVEAYSFSQLKQYYLQNVPPEEPEESVPKSAKASWDLPVSPWKSRRSTLDRPLNAMKPSKKSSRDVATRILRHIWDVDPRSVLEALGEMEAKIQPWQKQLLLHRETDGRPNYKVLVDPSRLTDLAAIMYRPNSRLMRVIANRVDALYIMETIRSKLVEVGEQSHRTRFWLRGASDSHTLNEICSETGVVAQSSAAGETRIYGMDNNIVRSVAHKLASISWERSVPSDTISLAVVNSAGKVQPYATALVASSLRSYASFHANPISKRPGMYRLVEPRREGHSTPIDLSQTALTSLADTLSSELDGTSSHQPEEPVKRKSTNTFAEAEHRWSAEICSLYHENAATGERPPTPTHHLPHVQTLLSYFNTRHRHMREVTVHFMGKSSKTQRHLLDAKWLVDQKSALEATFQGLTESTKKDRILLALPLGAADLCLTRTTFLSVDPLRHPWVQDVTFRDHIPGEKVQDTGLKIVDKAGDLMLLDEVQVTDPRDERRARNVTGPRTYTRQCTEAVHVVELVPRIDASSESVEAHVKNLLLDAWPDGVALQFRHAQGHARQLHVISTNEGDKSSSDVQLAVLKAGLIIAQLLTWASEGRVAMYASE